VTLEQTRYVTLCAASTYYARCYHFWANLTDGSLAMYPAPANDKIGKESTSTSVAAKRK